jgi:hypothetical protein
LLLTEVGVGYRFADAAEGVICKHAVQTSPHRRQSRNTIPTNPPLEGEGLIPSQIAVRGQKARRVRRLTTRLEAAYTWSVASGFAHPRGVRTLASQVAIRACAAASRTYAGGRKGGVVIAQTGFSGGALATLFLILHVAAGCVAILAGAAALSVAKGERQHRKIWHSVLRRDAGHGRVRDGAVRSQAAGHDSGQYLCHVLVASAWATVKRPEGTLGRFEKAAFLVAAG